jgi:hypothetical protein
MDLLLPFVPWAVLTLVTAILAGEMLRAGRAAEGPRAFADRWGVVGKAAFVVLFTAYTLLVSSWLVIPEHLWWVNVAVVAVALAAGAARWHALPWSAADKGARGRRIGALLTSAATVAVVLFLAL